MKHAKQLTTRAAALALAIALVACATPDGVTAPVARVPTKLIAASPLDQEGIAGSSVLGPPVVSVLDENGAPMKNVAVRFAVTAGAGTIAQDLVKTDVDGFAGVPWRLGDAGGENILIATVPGIKPVVFRAMAVIPANGARWDLLLIGEQHLPLTYSGPGASWSITGGHYVFVGDSTYIFGYEVDGVDGPSTIGRYVRLDSSTVQLYVPECYAGSDSCQERGGLFLFATGTIQGSVMTVTYEDFIDFEKETYVKSPN